jgi:hypothetical protein
VVDRRPPGERAGRRARALSWTVLRLQVDVVPEDRGGRRRPIPDGYRCSLSFGQRRRREEEAIVHDGLLVWERPGVARVWMVEPQYLPSFGPGRVITLLEGERIVARADVLDVLADDAPSPLADLDAARTRPLSAGSRREW